MFIKNISRFAYRFDESLPKMQKGWSLSIIILLITNLGLAGCAAIELLNPQASYTPIPTGTKVIFPATWTELPPTNTSTNTPTPANSPTITPTDTPTPTTSQIIPSADTDPSPTLNWLKAPLPDCFYTVSEPGVRILTAPFIDPDRTLPTMEPGKPYLAIVDKPTYSLIIDNGQPLGWVDYRLIALSMEGSDCLSRQDGREITDFTTLCFFTPFEETETYFNSDLTEPSGKLIPSSSYVLLRKSTINYYSAVGHAGPSFFVDPETVYTHGNCDNVPSLGEINTETTLYSLPPEESGSVISNLSVGQTILIQTQTKSGNPPPGISITGYWVLVRLPGNYEDINGWIWSEHLTFK